MLAVIVVSYNTRDLLRDCLRSVFIALERSRLQGQLWVVDNASPDGSAEMVGEEFPPAHLIASPENRGFAAANNMALRAVGSGQRPEAVLFLNPDTRIENDAMGHMYRALIDNPRVGAVGAALVYQDGGFQHSAFRFPDLFQIFFDLFPVHHRLTDSRLNGRYPRAWYARGNPFPIDHPLGAAFMVRWDTLQEVGLLDERFFIYCEEIDWCMRCRQKGWEILCVPQARIVHHAGQSTRQFREKMFVALWKSRFLLFEKHYGPLFRWTARQLVSLGMKNRIRKARAALARNEIASDELIALKSAYRQIMEHRWNEG